MDAPTDLRWTARTDRHARPGDARSAHLGHGSVQFPVHYCMPKEIFGADYAFLPRDQVLSFEEIERTARAFVSLGVEKLRITGGEPLVRRDLPHLIAMLAAIRRPDGGEIDLTLTTNGSALRALAGPLAAAGLRRVTVSLDSLDDAVFGAMNGIDFPVAKVLDGIDAAIEAGLAPVKINMVVRRGINESSMLPMAALGARDRRDPALHRIHGRRTFERLAPRRGRPRRRDRRRDRRCLAGRGGRAGLSRRGRRPLALHSTAAASSGSSRRSPSRSAATAPGPGSRPRGCSTPASSRPTGTTCGRSCAPEASDADFADAIEAIWLRRGDRYSELRSGATSKPAADRDVRDGRLTVGCRRSPQPVHSGGQLVDGGRSRSP